MVRPIADNLDYRSKFFKSIRLVCEEMKDCVVLLNDRHANNRTIGSKLWYKAKIKERSEFPSGSVPQRVQRAKKEFKQISTRIEKCDPMFLRMLNEKEISEMIGEYETCTGDIIRSDLYRISSGKKEYIYAEATSQDVEKNMKSFRLTKTDLAHVSSSVRAPINKLDDDANFDSSAKIPEMTAGALMQFLVDNCGVGPTDAQRQIITKFLKSERGSIQLTSQIDSKSAVTKSSSANIDSIDQCQEPKAKRARSDSSKEKRRKSGPLSPSAIASGRSTPSEDTHARDRVFEDLDDLNRSDIIDNYTNLLSSLGETSPSGAKMHEPRPDKRDGDETVLEAIDDFEFFSKTIGHLDINLKPSDYFPA